MEIQTLSIVVPAGCPNRCFFCVSNLHEDSEYANQIENNRRFKALYRSDFIKRMSFARDNGCNTMIYTGDGEPLANMRFLEDVSEWNNRIPNPFRWIELQTSGVTLDDEKLRWLRNTIEVSTISLSLSSIFSSRENAEYNRTPEKVTVDIDKVCKEIKRYDFNLRLSLNMTDFYNNKSPRQIFERARELQADQLTFRVLYSCSGDNLSPEQQEVNDWIYEHSVNESLVKDIRSYILENGVELETLPFGAKRYAIHDISTVIDDDCMNTVSKNVLKYLILRPNCKLYSRWDQKGAVLF